MLLVIVAVVDVSEEVIVTRGVCVCGSSNTEQLKRENVKGYPGHSLACEYGPGPTFVYNMCGASVFYKEFCLIYSPDVAP